MAKLNALGSVSDFLLWYARDLAKAKYRTLFDSKQVRGTAGAAYQSVQATDGSRRRLTRQELEGEEKLPGGSRLYTLDNSTSPGWSESLSRPYSFRSHSFSLTGNLHWKTTKDGLDRLCLAGRLESVGSSLRYVRFIDDFPVIPRQNIWTDTGTGGFGDEKFYVVQTVGKVVERCLLMTTDPGDLILDPTCGSGTTAVVAEQWGRRWVTVDTSRVALALARSRVMSARFPYFLLKDSEDGARKEAELTGLTNALTGGREFGKDVRQGFVYERVPHVTLKSIANNEEVDVIHAKFEERIEPLRSKFSKARGLKRTLEEWELTDAQHGVIPAGAMGILDQIHKLRRERQSEIDASITRRADTEFLFDRPYADPKRVRVTGPFTVESLSPHRVLSIEEERPRSEEGADAGSGAGFALTILENLRKAGVQNARKKERLKFDRLDPFPGSWVHFAGEFTDANDAVRRVAVSLGPEHGTVGPKQIQEAAKEALKGVGFDFLLVLGFAFDAHASETAREITPAGLSTEEGFAVRWEEQFGRLPVLLVRMNPDLAMGEDLLKKTGSGNLFMVFGEPEVEIREAEGSKLVVELRGVDVYDPTTGIVRSSSIDDIACWFIDTDYDEESFFVRHAYFLGADEPYEKLKRALRADIDEAAWSTLYSPISRAFDRPSTGKIAVKAINHYGDEVLKVFAV